MSTGTIKFFNAAKGFGFVTPDGGGSDLFLPAATLTAAGMTAISPGLRITFEQAPDIKGPKVVSLKLVRDASNKPVEPATERVVVYCDTGADLSADVIEAVRGSGFSMTTQDYIAAPPSVDQLKHLSQLLSASGQSLVRRYDPLFLGLQLDDRFMTDQDFWTAIVEHPVLINGPVLTVSGRARVCKTAAEVRAFLRKDEATSASKPRTLSPRIVAMLRGEALPGGDQAAPVKLQAPPPAAELLLGKKTHATVKTTEKSKSPPKPKHKALAKTIRARAPAKTAAPRKAVKPANKSKKGKK